MKINAGLLSRAQGCLLGQLAGDSLGSLVEFATPAEIARLYPDGVRELAAGGTWDTLAGQPTDDSELALALARSLISEGRYHPGKVKAAYVAWLKSAPFDVGSTIRRSLSGLVDTHSQANGALMRVSPLGIFGARRELGQVAAWARSDASLTHAHPVCQQVNALFVMAVACAVGKGPAPQALYRKIQAWALDMDVEPEILDVITAAGEHSPSDYLHRQGWVLTAFQNALFQLCHAETLAQGVIDTVGRGGDTDTNAAICGALLGAVYGREQVPRQWQDCVLGCRPDAATPGVKRPRPAEYWPADALAVVDALLA